MNWASHISAVRGSDTVLRNDFGEELLLSPKADTHFTILLSVDG